MLIEPKMEIPSQFKRRILLAVSGLTPQIVTETLYALAITCDIPFKPTEIHLLSTQEGADRARLLLLSKSPGWFYRICEEYNLFDIRFVEENIHVVRDSGGSTLADIRTAEENQCVADFITEQIRTLTSDPESALHVSLAGGRKTMGFYAGYALSLFGRPQDRLSHVLVQPDYESASEFFYPTPSRSVIEGKDKKPLDASEAKVTLADIPFVRMRQGLPDALLNGSSSFCAVVQAAGDTIGAPDLTIDQAGCRIQAAGKTFSMRRSSVAMLSVFARRAMNGAGPISAPPKGVSDPEWSALYLRELRYCIEDAENLSDLTRMSLKHGMDGELFSMHLSRLQRSLRETLGAQSVPYLIDSGGTRPGKFRCTLPSRAIHFQPLPPPQYEKQRKIS